MENNQGLRTTIYYVNDLQAAKNWYASVFETEPYFDEPFYVGYNIGGYELGLHPTESDAKDKHNGVITYWASNDVQQAIERVLKLGAAEGENAQEVGGGIITGHVIDPWGNALGFIYNPHFRLPAE